MESEIISFDKSFEQRFREYKDIFGSNKLLPASQVRPEWSYVAELVLEPVGWRALWRIPTDRCEELGISFPTILLVMVEGVDAKLLTAEVNALNAKEDSKLPNHFTVYLVDLYVTVHQVNEALYTRETADFIDKLRFFYHHVWMPWDVDDEEKQDWLTTHLEPRLKLYYDMQAGSVSSEMVLHIQYLIQEGQRIQSKISVLEDQVDDETDVESAMCDLLDLHFCKNQIKNRFEMYEDPYKRSLLVWKQHRKSCEKNEKDNNSKVVFVIWPGGSLEEYINVLKKANSFIKKEETVKSTFQLQETLNHASSGDSVLLSEGNHGLLGLGGLEKGGSIKGLAEPVSTILRPHDAGNILLDCSGGVITLENLTIDIQQMQIAILVRDATLHVRNCHLIGQNNSNNTGILILGGGCVVARDCQLSGFGAAIVIYAKGEASVTSCNIHSCHVGIKVQDDAKLNLMKCNVSGCHEFGIKGEISKQSAANDNEVGSITLLRSVGEVQLSDTNIRNNTKGDVCIVQRKSGLPSSNEMENPAFSFLLFNNHCFTNTVRPDGHGDE